MVGRWLAGPLLASALGAGQADAETIELRCVQQMSEVYSMSRTGMLSMEYDNDVEVLISLDTETDRATLAPNAGLFDVGDEQVLIMMVSEQLKEVWEIERGTGHAMIMAYLVDEPRTVFIRREAQCSLPAAMTIDPAQ